MTFEQIYLLAVLVAALALFIWARWRYDLVAIAVLLAAVLGGAVPFDHAFLGFGHPAVVTVAAVLILSRGLQNSGAVELIARHMLPPIASVPRHVGLLSGVAAALSAVMNNVGALAILMPAALSSAAAIKRSPSVILMPLSFGSLLGGLVTLIGTPPNIIIAAFRADVSGAPFTMFDFTPVGGAVALAGVAFMALVGWRLIPVAKAPRLTTRELFEIDTYVAEARVPKDSPLIGQKLTDADDMASEFDAVILGLSRRGRHFGPGQRGEPVRTNDVLLVEASPEALGKLMESLKLKRTTRRDEKAGVFGGADVALAEASVPPGSRVVGRSNEGLNLRRRHGVNLMAVSRQGHAFRGRLKTFRFKEGDVLLLEGDAERLPEVIAELGLLPLAGRGVQITQQRRAGLAIAIFAAAIAAATVGLMTFPVALVLAAALMVVLNIVPAREVYDSIDWPVVVLLGAMIPVGNALGATGTTGLVAGLFTSLAAVTTPAIVLVLVMIATMALSDVMNNAATAIVMAPIGATVAVQLGVNPDTFLMGVAVAASSAFLTPIGHQNNTLIMGPGGYAFGDYWRLGLPLDGVVLAVAVPMLLWVWPL